MRLIHATIILFFLGVVTIGCSSVEKTTSSSDDSKPVVYTSVYPFQYAVEQIAGDTVTVKTVYPPGSDAHTYEPTSKDMTAIADSDAFIYLGAGMEGFAETIADALGSQDAKLIEIGKYDKLFHGGHSHDGTDHDDVEGNPDPQEEHDHEEENDDHSGDHGHGEDNHEHEEKVHNHGERGQETSNDEKIVIEGLLAHYHTGDTIKLTATLNENTDYDHWHWFTLNPGEQEWTAVEGQTSDRFEGESTINGQQIKAVLFDDEHHAFAESEPVTVEINDHEGDHNPHIWVDPLRMIKVAEIIKDQLSELNPDEADAYNKNFEKLKSKLTALDEKYTSLLATKSNKAIIVSHAAFGYWEERYGLEQIAISGLSSSSEPSQKQLKEIIEQSAEHNLDYVLFEQNSSNRLSKIVQEEIGAKPLTIHNLEVLTQKDIDNGEDYISLMERNLEVLDQATK